MSDHKHDKPLSQAEFLERLTHIAERIANEADLQAVGPLMDMTTAQVSSPELSALAESFARMLVKLEAREFELECTIADLKAVKIELEKANYDALTGLPNRVIARDRLNQGLANVKRSEGMLAVLFMDLDRFKWVNDNRGHAAGDELLQQVAVRAKASVRDSDTVARLGGDEFLAVLPAVGGLVEAQVLAQRMVDTMNQPFALRDGEVQIGASVGIALYPQHAQTVDALIECADAGLYMAKRAGKNVFRVYEPPEDLQQL